MKRWIHASTDVITINSPEELYDLLENTHYNDKGTLKISISDDVLEDSLNFYLYDRPHPYSDYDNNLGHFLYALRYALKPSSFKQIKSRLAKILKAYHHQLHSDLKNDNRIMQAKIGGAIMSEGIPGLVVERLGQDYLTLNYLNEERYDIDSQEYINNYDEIVKMIESIPAVGQVQGGAVSPTRIRVSWNTASNDTTVNYNPTIIDPVPRIKRSR